MRKYFLTSAVALLAASNVIAASYAEVTANAEVTFAVKSNCSNLEFGNIILDLDTINNNLGATITIDENGYTASEGVLRVVDYQISTCDFENVEVPESITLYDGEKELGVSLTVLGANSEKIGGTFSFDESVQEGNYTGKFTVVSLL
ncbi:MAG: hypothetical protein IJ019_00205 [Alphaproteobacteria bacterium]|nr:hypothetical protein [Alphaproteobacteria bacterium]